MGRSVIPTLAGAAAAAALIGGVMALPHPPMSGVASSPTASWAVPAQVSQASDEVSSAELASLLTACAKMHTPLTLKATDVVASERRGEEVLALVRQRTTQGVNAVFCLATLPSGASAPTWTTRFEAGGPASQQVPPRKVEAGETRGPGLGGTYALWHGTVGSNVKAITVHQDGMNVPITVKGGAAFGWWASPKPTSSLPVPPSAESTGTMTIEFTDGTREIRSLRDDSVVSKATAGVPDTFLTSKQAAAFVTACGPQFGKEIAAAGLSADKPTATERRDDDAVALWSITRGGNTEVYACLGTLKQGSSTPTKTTWERYRWPANTGARETRLTVNRSTGGAGTYTSIAGPVGQDVTAVDVLAKEETHALITARGFAYSWWRGAQDPVTAGRSSLILSFADGSNSTVPWTGSAPTPGDSPRQGRGQRGA